MGQPGSESLLYEAGNPCRWVAQGVGKGREREGGGGRSGIRGVRMWRKSKRDEPVVTNRPASTLQLAKVQRRSCFRDIVGRERCPFFIDRFDETWDFFFYNQKHTRTYLCNLDTGGACLCLLTTDCTNCCIRVSSRPIENSASTLSVKSVWQKRCW